MPHEVIMPALGMAQKTGLIVTWLKKPGEAVRAGEALMEVETDKAVMQVDAQADGYLTDVRTAAGEEAPVGDVIALISDTPGGAATASPPQRSERPAARAAAPNAPAAAPRARPPSPPVANSGRIFVSPKAKRIAAERGLDLSRLVAAGVPQPYHVADLARFDTLPPPAARETTATSSRRLAARVRGDGFAQFLEWIAQETGSTPDAQATLAGMAAACLRGAFDERLVVAADSFGRRRLFVDPDRVGLGRAQAVDDAGPPSLILRDLRATAISDLSLGPEVAPVLSLIRDGVDLIATLECAPSQLSPQAAVDTISAFAGRLTEPLRHLL